MNSVLTQKYFKNNLYILRKRIFKIKKIQK